ncbi:APC family permease [Goodfellowiella coeruleoviolacea]|uniref:Amino acid/polyamine/organocation transporter, APC superfamily (TC 2.A.3) n=1 Tax=Goodfellowiella coeruleoviolacea TaxID=334858 RepID=A0AAE3GMW2_9PSEU|nr:APC family permease [Goodfellowiella coeruleoviolacea]MCP2170412.1 amino acid/polyamine/organocation transporter, APC superfamily (TC 2.A.3) [Goodfellowiella coeruleoviolacea]
MTDRSTTDPATTTGSTTNPATANGATANGATANGAAGSAADGALRRSLGLRDLIVYGLLFIGPVAPISVFGVLDAGSGGAVALVFVVATVAMAFTAWSYAQMSAAVPRAGSVSAYASAGLGRPVGFVAGWMIALDYLFIPSVAALFTGIATHSLLPSVPAWLATAVAIVLITSVNVAGVRVAAVVGTAVLVVEVVLLAVFVVAAVVVLVTDGPHRPWLSPLVGVGGFDLGAVLGSVSVAVLSFLGFDAIASFAEENTGSSRQVGRAVLVCLVLAGVLFLAQTYLGALLSAVPPDQLAADPAAQGPAFFDMLRTAIGGWLSTAVTAVKAISPMFAAMVGQAAVSRLMYGMARDGQLPRWLGRVDERTHTPRTAILVSAAATLVISVWAASRSDGLDVLSSLVTVGALTAFGLLHAAVVGYFPIRLRSRRWWSHLVVPVVGTAIIVTVLALASRVALLVAGGWLVLGVLIAAARSLAGRRR